MKRLLSLIIICLGLLSFANASEAVIINFDDLTGQASLPTNYAGLTWSSNWWYYDWPQEPYAPHSGTVRTYTLPPLSEGRFHFPQPVNFAGAWFAGYDFANLYFQAYLGPNLIGTSSSFNPTEVSTFLVANFPSLVDEVVVVALSNSGSSNGYYVMDDVTYYNETVVPEPSSLLLLGAGLVGLLRKRKHNLR